jgi:hypothetical protein
MQAEESRGADEGDREAEHARVAAACGRLAGEERKRSGDHAREEYEPEVRGLVLPVEIQPRPGEQERQPREGDGEKERQRRD